MVYGEWTVDGSNAKAISHKRTVTYIRPLQIPIPLAPKQCNVTEVQTVGRGCAPRPLSSSDPLWPLHPVKLLARGAGGFVLETRITTNAPKGDTFYVLIQWTGTAEQGGSKTRVGASFKVRGPPPLFPSSPPLNLPSIRSSSSRTSASSRAPSRPRPSAAPNRCCSHRCKNRLERIRLGVSGRRPPPLLQLDDLAKDLSGAGGGDKEAPIVNAGPPSLAAVSFEASHRRHLPTLGGVVSVQAAFVVLLLLLLVNVIFAMLAVVRSIDSLCQAVQLVSL